MLAQKFRLTKPGDFKLIFQQGQKIFTPLFVIRYQPSRLANSRFTVIVSNKISKQAVARNKIKRRLREIIRLNISQFKQNYDLIITVLAPAVQATYVDLEKAYLSALKKYKLF